MKKNLLSLVAALAFFAVNGQSVLHYDFLNTLNERNGNGPALTVLGNTGIYVTDTLNEINGKTKTVYRFEKNNGLQFNNTAAANFIGNTYTIELYFVFDELSSWKRVVDWKNRKTDWGAYVYYGQLNFYSIVYSGEAPVHEGEYTYYVITRNGATNDVLIYTDADKMISFNDASGNALIDSDGVLNFFYDDLSVPNEAAPGAVAMLNLYNYILDSNQIKSNWQQIGSTVFGMEDAKNNVFRLKVSPNPATDYVKIDMTEFRNEKQLTIQLTDQTGKTVFQTELKDRENTFRMNTGAFKPGLYFLRLTSEHRTASCKLVVN